MALRRSPGSSGFMGRCDDSVGGEKGNVIKTNNTITESNQGRSVLRTLKEQRELLAYQLRKEGLPFSKIGERLNVSPPRARQIYISAEYSMKRPAWWTDGLSVRAQNCLWKLGVSSREQAFEVYQKISAGRLNPRNYGRKTHEEVAKWLGLPDPQKSRPEVYPAERCPHCGERLT